MIMEICRGFDQIFKEHLDGVLVGRLFHNALEESRPKSVLFNCLCVCISLLDPKRQTFGTYHAYSRQLSQGSSITPNPEIVEGMLGSLGRCSCKPEAPGA